ncbi:LysM peptidoglycan-binding domain-containing protein [Psychromonas sp. CD1]|uniref:LysM peptidoglycan-binding domain-containing protein n=1 Tax=Psychromonas sp. CD1 TaxID=1979839 RepID=UPI000B9AFF2D|nr:LysM peptidoglycan-binding domain-containing protein [Psychromonas sp. CD1]
MKVLKIRLTLSLLIINFLFCFFSGSVSAGVQNKLNSVRSWPSPDNTRVVLDLSKQARYSIHYLKKPDRLVIDLKSTTSVLDFKKIKHTGPLVKNIRRSITRQSGVYRLVIDLKQASKAVVFSLSPEPPYGHRLVIDLPYKKTIKTKPEKVIRKITPVGRNVIIAVDAGHGGEDPGASGRLTQEKKITLQIAQRLKRRIDQQKGMSAILIRTGDYYINLNKRSELAHQGKADFLVSIHADGFTSSQPSGASVWILSDRRANSEMGRRMERHEVHSELLGGIGNIKNESSSVPFLNKMFFDMSKSNSMLVAEEVAYNVVAELNKITKLHKKKPESASLAVLKSPYIPSILVEAGFITNYREERLLGQASYQNKVANAIFNAIYKHFIDSPPHDSLFAQRRRTIKHTVRSGESLSNIAQRYSIPLLQLKSYNNLHSNRLKIGQTLKIPADYELVVKLEDKTNNLSLVEDIWQKTRIYKVKNGESLSIIAQRYGSTVSQLKQKNNLHSSVLWVGQKIKIPGGMETNISSQDKYKQRIYKVQQGDTLSEIAAKYDISLAQIKRFNTLRSNSVFVGQKLYLSALKNSASNIYKRAQIKIYTVKRGDSLSVIAHRYGLISAQLKSFNQLRSTELAIGQKLRLTAPVSSRAKITKRARIHRVKRGESLSVIAHRYGLTSAQLKNFNQLRSTELAIGQKLRLTTLVSSRQKVTQLSRTHKVKSGESLSVIAQQYGTTTECLKRINQLRSSVLKIGQKLKLSDFRTASKDRVHKVRSGENLSGIAKENALSVTTLMRYNQLSSSSLSIGQIIKIPAVNAVATPYKVRRGESLSIIAQRYGVSVKKLKQFNHLNTTDISVGQRLRIPVS